MPEQPKTLRSRVTGVWVAVDRAEKRAVDVWRYALPGELTTPQWEEARAIERDLAALRKRVLALSYGVFPDDPE